MNTPSWYWNTSTASWQTAAYDGTGGFATPPGNYTVMAVSTLNNVRENYRNVGADYTGKTVSATYAITIAGSPVLIDFNANPPAGDAPLTVRFNVTRNVTSPTRWNWRFGDGGRFNTSVSAQRNTTHLYANPGVYTVNLSITNASGTYSTSKPAYINVTPVQPFTVSGTVYYTGAKTGTIHIEIYNQTLAGGLLPSATVTLPSPGSYTIPAPNETCWMLAWMDVGDKGYQGTDDPVGSPVNKSMEYRPDTIVAKGNVTGIDITLYEIAHTDSAQFQITADSTAHAQNNSLSHGIYPVESDRGLNINGNPDGVFIIDTMNVKVTGSNFTTADPSAVGNSTRSPVELSGRYALQPWNPMDVGWWGVDSPGETRDIPISLNRKVNQSVFSEPGYQKFRFNVSFENTSGDWIYGRISTGGNYSGTNTSLLTGASRPMPRC